MTLRCRNRPFGCIKFGYIAGYRTVLAQTAEFASLVAAALSIHWQDHEELQGYWLPEWSHLSGSEADRCTKALYHVIQGERASSAK